MDGQLSEQEIKEIAAWGKRIAVWIGSTNKQVESVSLPIGAIGVMVIHPAGQIAVQFFPLMWVPQIARGRTAPVSVCWFSIFFVHLEAS